MISPVLSILICHLEDRSLVFQRLLDSLARQFRMSSGALNPSTEIAQAGLTELIIEKDNGHMSTGQKRNKLLERARGDYIAFVDDDDMVDENYVSRIESAIQCPKCGYAPDCLGLEGLIYIKNVNLNKLVPQKFIHSLKYKSWFEKDGVFYRNPNHLNPVKREIALKVRFPHWTQREDFDYSQRMLPLLKTEEMLSGNPLYHYYP